MNYNFHKTLIELFYPVAVCSLILSSGIETGRAQLITPATDGTGTTVTSPGGNPNQFDISGGTQAGSNLFHSFQQFGLDANQVANFLTNQQIQNILARVVGGDVSVINGLLQVSGGQSNLYLLNPAGIVFGPSASLNVPAAFTATTANGIGFDNNWFKALGSNDYTGLVGNPDSFAFAVSQPGAIVNAGNLAVGPGQSLTLLGGTVVNTGALSAPAGSLTIAAVSGETLLRISQEGGLLSLDLPLDMQQKLMGNGQVLSPLSLPALLTGGTVPIVTGLTVENGVVKLASSGASIPSAPGTAIVSHNLNVSGPVGGTLMILGETVGLLSASLNASGTNGGGTVLIGGDYQGQGSIPRSQLTYVSPDSSIQADALTNGNGGRVIVWSDQATQFYGSISAQGGELAGNGGLVETSGKLHLEALGSVDASAPNGAAGVWLLDPTNITIQATGSDTNSIGRSPFTPPDDNTVVTTRTIEAALNGGTSVTIRTAISGSNPQAGDIIVADNITKTSGGNASLTLQAANSIFVNSGVAIASTVNQLNVTLNADYDGSGMGVIILNSGSAINSNGGNIVLGSGIDPLSRPAIRTTTDSSGVYLTGARLNSGTGNISIQGSRVNIGSNTDGLDLENGAVVQATPQSTLSGFYNTSQNPQLGRGQSSSSLIQSQVGKPGSPDSASRPLQPPPPQKGPGDASQPKIPQTAQRLSSPEVESIRTFTEGRFTVEFGMYLGLAARPVAPTSLGTRNVLSRIEAATGVKSAFVYIQFTSATRTTQPLSFLSKSLLSPSGISTRKVSAEERAGDSLEVLILSSQGEPIGKQIPSATRAKIMELSEELRSSITNSGDDRYLSPAQQLYQLVIAPVEAELQAQGVSNLLFMMDVGLRSIPLAALHDGKQFLIEKYSLGLTPSVSLTDARYTNLKNAQVLAMGASKFEDQNPLPAVPEELSIITKNLWAGQSFLNEAFTLENLKTQRRQQPYKIIHLATHGEFKPGVPANSYIQLWDTRLRMDQIRELGWSDPPVELLVLSACRTALGDRDAELGFAGLAVLSGVKSALGSLWYVSDEGTLGLMTEFYQQLKTAPIKAEALRQAQLAMLQGKVHLEAGQLLGSRGEVSLPRELAALENKDLSHPYYWAAFTMIGSPW